MRREVLRKIRATAQPDATLMERWFGWLRLPFAEPLRAAAMAGIVLALIGSGVLIGRQWQGETVLVGDVAGLTREASGNLEVSDSEGSPYAYTNVTFGEPRDGTLVLSFDVTRHMRIERSKDDPLVREILVQSLLNPSPVGTRLEAIRHAGRMIDPKVREALVLTMLNDPNQAVRTRALEILGEHDREPEVQSALLAVLRGEESVQMRLMALDRLAAGGLEEERFDLMMDELDRRDDRALLVRAASYRGPAATGAGDDGDDR